MKTRRMIDEIFVLRSIACMCIVFLHSIDIALRSSYLQGIGPLMVTIFDSIQVFLYFGTPVFIFMSELIIAYSYRNRPIPDGFMKKRFMYIFVPFLFMAFFYSLPYATTFGAWGEKFLMNVVIGDFHGYFVLIIFQFYILHLLFHQYLRKADPKVVIPLALSINIAYLALFNMTAAPISHPVVHYIWDRFYWVPFFGWIFYFAVGYYCGHYYETFRDWVFKYRKIIIAAPIVSTTLLLIFYHNNILLVHSSKRVDILLHTVAIMFFIMYIGQKIKTIPPFLIQISQYSFGIYLLHMFFIHTIDLFVRQSGLSFGATYIFILFFLSLFCSMGTMMIASRWKHGKYFVGKIGVGKDGKPPKTPEREPEEQLKPRI
ncbi:acyltransferase family protein [Bacillus sp. H-16]|uniref:acyltransferase family protein n=1 Tax=Alteribacter salitolerans TaxID=2912333 RepID=UPI001965AC54|nr:acyltransferase family protein [Alteribacter salitolerans]MBM7094461.1 acyltransferase family protein [Alteribacter salitolerans]